MPTKEEVKAARKAAGLTTEAAAALVGKSGRSWQAWEYGRNAMPVADWELFQLKTKRKGKTK